MIIKDKMLSGTERMLTLDQIQEAAGVSRATVYRWRQEQGLKTFRCGGSVRVRVIDWEAWLAEHTGSVEGGKKEKSNEKQN